MMSLSLPHTHTHAHTHMKEESVFQQHLGDYVNEMKYSDGLVSQLNVCDCGEETETKRRRGEQGRLTAGRREREREAASAFSRSVCLPVALPRHSLRCDGLWEVMTHDNFHCCIQTQGETQQSGRQVSHSGRLFVLSFHLALLLSLASFFSHTVASHARPF